MHADYLDCCEQPTLEVIRPLYQTGGPRRPDRVGDWLNAWCPADAVAIGCPLRDDWGDRLSEVITSNPKDRAHSIEEYLADGRVAAAVGAALGATPR